MNIFCSTIIPTINRSTLTRAVNSVLDQDFSEGDFEVIVVNDSDHPLPDSEWQHSGRVRVVNTNCRERSVARNTGAAIAHGKYLHFLDDDDVLLPGALNAFWKLSQINNSAWMYGGYQTVDNQGGLIEEFIPEINGNIFALLVSGEAIPFQASLLDAKIFFTAGAFDPKITGGEDRDVGRRIALFETVSNTSSVVAKIRIGEIGSSTNWATLNEFDRWGREKALREQNAYTRLRKSANSAYIKGRVFRAILGSVRWNLKRKNIIIIVSRVLLGTTFIIPYFILPKFWSGFSGRN